MIKKLLKKIPKNEFEKYFFKLINNVAFCKTMQIIEKDRNSKLNKKKKKIFGM